MASYTVKTTVNQEAGITAAREAYNATLPVESTDVKETNADYLAFVVSSAFESYQKQHKVGSEAA